MSSSLHPYIDSVKHEALKTIRDFQQRKTRNEAYVAVIDGHKELLWALEHHADIEMLIATDASKDSAAVIECERRKAQIFIARDTIFKRYFTSFDDEALAALVKLKHVPSTKPKKMALLLEDIVDHGNIGTIIRSALSFGVDHFYASNPELDWFSKKSIKASRGAHFKSNFHAFNNIEESIKNLKQSGYQIIGTSPHASSLISLSSLAKKPLVLMVGNEQHGLSDHALKEADAVVRIPMFSDVESLNVAVATGISIYELYFRLVLTMLSENIQNNIGRNIGILFQLFPKVLDNDLSQCSKLNANQVIFLMILKLDGKMSVSQAEEDLARLGENGNLALAFLEREGLIENLQDSYQISPQGEQDLVKLWMVVENAEAKIISVLSEQEQLELRSMLSRLLHQCTDLIDKKS